MTKAIKGFLIAPLVPCFVFVILAAIAGSTLNLIYEKWSGLISIPIIVMGSFFWLMYALPVSYFLSLLFGVPMYLLFDKIGLFDLKSYIIGSLLSGIVSGSFEELYLFPSNSFSWTSFWIIGAGGFFGAITGFSFWTIVYGKSNNIFDRFFNRWREEFPRG